MPEDKPVEPTLAEVFFGPGTAIPVPVIKNAADDRAASEKRDFGQERHDEDLSSLRQDRRQRGTLSWCIFWLVVVWLIFVGYTLLAVGFKWWGFVLSDGVIIALLGTTTANIIGVLLAVTGYLFPKRP